MRNGDDVIVGGNISKNNVRTLVTMPKDLKEIAEYVAKKENRSLSNLIVISLQNYINNFINTNLDLKSNSDDIFKTTLSHELTHLAYYKSKCTPHLEDKGDTK